MKREMRTPYRESDILPVIEYHNEGMTLREISELRKWYSFNRVKQILIDYGRIPDEPLPEGWDAERLHPIGSDLSEVIERLRMAYPEISENWLNMRKFTEELKKRPPEARKETIIDNILSLFGKERL